MTGEEEREAGVAVGSDGLFCQLYSHGAGIIIDQKERNDARNSNHSPLPDAHQQCLRTSSNQPRTAAGSLAAMPTPQRATETTPAK